MVQLHAAPVLRVVKAESSGAPLLRNGGFETQQNGEPDSWRPWQRGFQLAPGQGRNGSNAVRCERREGQGEFGIGQNLTLNRTSVAPIVVRGWSRAEDVNGGADSGYSLYVDLVYADDTPQWGQTAHFLCGTHDWQLRELVILPDKPVKSLTLYCLFRGHTGRVWFDDISVSEQQAGKGAVICQGVPVLLPSTSPLLSSTLTHLKRTQDGLSLFADDRGNVGIEVEGKPLSAAGGGGFLVRDVAADSDFCDFRDGNCSDLDLRVEADFIERDTHLVVEGKILDRGGRDRAVTLLFGLPVNADGWQWGDDLRQSRRIEGTGEYVSQVAIRCGATGTLSLLPTGAIWNDRIGLAIGLDMDRPAQYRVGYHAGLQQLFIAYDFGLAEETSRFPSGAPFRFVIYRFDPRWGFRAAWQKYLEIFPEAFVVRSKQQGLWMPFTDVGTVAGWEDFGFRYHEGNNNVPWDDAHDVLSFRYTEPMTWWMAMAKDMKRTMGEAVRARDALIGDGNSRNHPVAEVSRVAAMYDASGQPALVFRDTPWCDGAVWSLNPNPWLTDSSGASATPDAEPLNAATLHWNERLKQSLYGPSARGNLDGEYLDSLEGYVTADLNYRREHFRFTTVPLTFASDTKQVALFKGLSVYEFTRWMSEDVHRMGKLMFANSVPYRFTFLCPWLDVMGTETDWLRGGQYHPASISQMDLWRTLSAGKPYLLLMNTDYDQFTPDRVDLYFQRCLFYGIWPGFFSHNAAENPYWRNPKWYERDRPLFKQYLPVIRRLAEAGWQPVTGVTCDNENLLVERFGPDQAGVVRFSVYNDTAETQSGVLEVDGALLKATPGQRFIREFPEDQAGRDSNQRQATLAPAQVAVFRLGE
ncbi:MAG: hypothetical protein H7A46_05675 [Verrucomicrobiales bacterium]|nr:hypothetical protein [Verrucomicrobiales bacterium]